MTFCLVCSVYLPSTTIIHTYLFKLKLFIQTIFHISDHLFFLALPYRVFLFACLFVFNFCSTFLEKKKRADTQEESTFCFIFVSFLGFCSDSVPGTLQPSLPNRITRK